MFGFKKWRRKRLMKKPLPDEWKQILHQQVPYVQHLPPELEQKLNGLINIFVKEKSFEGCAGLEITDEIRITVAAQACILLLGIEDLSSFYEGLRSVLIYPETYVARVKSNRNSFFVEEGYQRRHGEAWSRGHVVLAWNEVQNGASDIHDGRNLVFHEFAHQLDYDYGATNEIESTGDESTFLSWGWVVGKEYNKLLEAIRKNQHTLIDEYGATNLAEFFAVVTESFFEQPRALKKKHPELYRQLQQFYQQDPATYLNS
ncbi:zinc-dependent peptidase [Fodinibius halophilus]|uniref:Zinc-dependent peptidase n=1 Tax=Fodinibius halophilus TaxID=1736908 RepID=A0A6M1TFC3_9BACT|nr:M90 family metallopeptidase [Fodinibius halophilus]NGP87320.1 zinc-dependent peptidase [Fodinibius halophilus]